MKSFDHILHISRQFVDFHCYHEGPGLRWLSPLVVSQCFLATVAIVMSLPARFLGDRAAQDKERCLDRYVKCAKQHGHVWTQLLKSLLGTVVAISYLLCMIGHGLRKPVISTCMSSISKHWRFSQYGCLEFYLRTSFWNHNFYSHNYRFNYLKYALLKWNSNIQSVKSFQ